MQQRLASGHKDAAVYVLIDVRLKTEIVIPVQFPSLYCSVSRHVNPVSEQLVEPWHSSFKFMFRSPFCSMGYSKVQTL
jgi:hypothetical protein